MFASLLFLAFFAVVQATSQGPSECGPCDVSRYQHYLFRECQPVTEPGECCPSRFECKTEEELGRDPTQCYYEGKAFNIGDVVPTTNECHGHCTCTDARPTANLSQILCATIECPSVFNPRKEGCRGTFTKGSCCATGEDCSGEKVDVCTWGNVTANLGDKMYFDEFPCQTCVCTKEFEDPHGPGCSTATCDFEIKYRNRFAKGCTLVFFEKGCCAIETICPGDERITGKIIPAQTKTESASENNPVCRLGDLVVPLGSGVEVTDCKVRCDCRIPPDLTCERHRSCDAAQQTQDEETNQ